MTSKSPPTGKDPGLRTRSWAIRHLPALALAGSCIPLAFAWKRHLSLQGVIFKYFLRIPSLGTPNPYKEALSAYLGNRTFDSWALLSLASIAILVAVFWKRLRYPAVALALVASIVTVVSVPGDRAAFEHLVQAPYQPQLAVLDQFPAPQNWQRGNVILEANEYPYAQRWWTSNEPLDQVCKQLKAALGVWMGPETVADVRDNSHSCDFRLDGADNEIEGKAFDGLSEKDEITLKVVVTAKDPVKVEDFL